jgi:quercetin dioxygenase-like cupin family protein
VSLLDDPAQRLGVDLIVLGPREAVRRTGPADGTGVVAVAQGLVQVQVHDGHTPAVRPGEVLVAPAHTIEGWRNVSSHEAMVFWIVRAES